MKSVRLDLLCWLTGLGLFLWSAVVCPSAALDLQFHDVYFVARLSDLSVAYGIWFALAGGVYFLFRKLRSPLRPHLGSLHVGLSTAAALGVWGLLCSPALSGIVRRYDSLAPGSLSASYSLLYLLLGATALFLVGQLLFVINVIGALVRGKR